MKFVLIFLFCGITCCLAFPPCNEDIQWRCSPPPLNENATTEEDLERDCRHTKCIIEVYERCGPDVFPPRYPPTNYFPLKGYKKFVNTFCGKTSSLRRKYLENIKCMRDAVFEKKDIIKDCGFEIVPREEFCRKLPDAMKCAVEYITSQCGKDAGDVYAVGSVHLDPYDCLE